MSSRTTRRTRRAAVVDSDDELSMASVTQVSNNDDDDELAQNTSVASTSTTASRRTTRSTRKSSVPAPAPAAPARTRGRPKKTPTPEPEPKYEDSADEIDADVTAGMDTSRMSSATVAAADDDDDDLLADVTANATALKLEDEDQVTQLPAIAVQNSTPPKKRQSVPPSTTKPNAVPPTPQTTKNRPLPFQTPALTTPLGDMSTSGLNTQMGQTTVRANKYNTSFMDKPLDIMLKSRTTTIPLVEETVPKSRTVLSYLILDNFKSYAGRQEVGPFHSSFTSVVGPNGSGKSNVIDSLLFVFGFRASKMRQGKISALIHNSAEYPNLPYCEVAVHFKEVMDRVR